MIHKCVSYFYIKGLFPLNCITDIFSADEIGKMWEVGTPKTYGNGTYDFSGFQTHHFEEMGGIATTQFDSLLSILSNKISDIILLKKNFIVSTCIEIVPTIISNNSMSINIPFELLYFCQKTNTKIDIDYYISGERKTPINRNCSQLLISGRINKEIENKLVEMGLLDFSLQKTILKTKTCDIDKENVSVAYYANNSLSIHDITNKTMDILKPKINELKELSITEDLKLELLVSIYPINQISRPLISPSVEVINMCNLLKAGLKININNYTA